MKILVINAGSTSLKYQLIDSESEAVLAKGLCERIGADAEGGDLKYNSSKTGEKKEKQLNLTDHGVALKAVIDVLLDPEDGAISSLDEIDAVGHRVVHGGEYFSSSVKVDDDVIKKIEECSDLAPLHNPANLLGIKACQELMPNVPQCVTFDTAFHQTMPENAYIYGIASMRIIKSVVMVSMVQATVLYLQELQSFLESQFRTQRLSFVTSVVVPA